MDHLARIGEPGSSTDFEHSVDVLDSREQSQTALSYPPESEADSVSSLNPTSLRLETAANALNKFGFDHLCYCRAKRDLLASGWSEAQVFGRIEIDVDTLLLGFVDPDDSQTVPNWCSRTVNKLLPATPLPVRLASTWILTKLTRVSGVAGNEYSGN